MGGILGIQRKEIRKWSWFLPSSNQQERRVTPSSGLRRHNAHPLMHLLTDSTVRGWEYWGKESSRVRNPAAAPPDAILPPGAYEMCHTSCNRCRESPEHLEATALPGPPKNLARTQQAGICALQGREKLPAIILPGVLSQRPPCETFKRPNL